ncbi:uncharacterized protein JCM10292_007164 [Rhodotorula paludigena]|uniref:uncharacterized protein n=1 Tax=Rhodotorula paludigena TaxID=86838 RepID=UPI003180F8C5
MLPGLHDHARRHTLALRRLAPRRRLSSTPSLSSWLTVTINARAVVTGEIDDAVGATLSTLSGSSPKWALDALEALHLLLSAHLPLRREDVDAASLQITGTHEDIHIQLSTRADAQVRVQSVDFLLAEQRKIAKEAVDPVAALLHKFIQGFNTHISAAWPIDGLTPPYLAAHAGNSTKVDVGLLVKLMKQHYRKRED